MYILNKLQKIESKHFMRDREFDLQIDGMRKSGILNKIRKTAEDEKCALLDN